MTCRRRRSWIVAAGAALAAWTGCTMPGAIAPSTVPLTGKYVELSGVEEATSCGYTALVIPLSNPKPIAVLIDEMIKGRGGNALIQVSSSSSSSFYLVGVSHCVTLRGKVVNVTR